MIENQKMKYSKKHRVSKDGRKFMLTMQSLN